MNHNPSSDVEHKKRELVVAAEKVLDGSMLIMEAVRLITSLRHSVGDPDNPIFLPIRSLDSETDTFPVGRAREHYDKSVLDRLDNELAEYVATYEPAVKKACQEIIQAFASASASSRSGA